MLQNGLTLELCYDINNIGPRGSAADGGGGNASAGLLRASQGVWVYQEEVVLEVKVGQA
jgi:hypothetical protein